MFYCYVFGTISLTMLIERQLPVGLAELCARPLFSAFFEQVFDVSGDLKLRPKYTTAI